MHGKTIRTDETLSIIATMSGNLFPLLPSQIKFAHMGHGLRSPK